MSIINSANPGSQINLLCLIYRVIHRNSGKLTIDDIMEQCRPDNLPTVKDHEKRFGGNLRFWMQETHQLWTVDMQARLVLARESELATPEDIAAATCEVLHAELYDDIFKSKNHDIYPLFRCLGAILATDQYTVGSDKTLNHQELEDLFSRYRLKYPPNDSEKKYVLAYGHFLGYLEVAPGGNYVVDVTRAVRRIITELFGSDDRLNIEAFLKKLGTRLPMLDGGAYRQQIEEKMKNKLQGNDINRDISAALSLALERLRLGGVIATDAKADDPDAFFLQLGQDRKAVSQVELVRQG